MPLLGFFFRCPSFIPSNHQLKKILVEEAVETTKQKREIWKKPKREELEGMRQRQHCPPAP
jgi:molybdopterin synthase catalytic subunit